MICLYTHIGLGRAEVSMFVLVINNAEHQAKQPLVPFNALSNAIKNASRLDKQKVKRSDERWLFSNFCCFYITATSAITDSNHYSKISFNKNKCIQ